MVVFNGLQRQQTTSTSSEEIQLPSENHSSIPMKLMSTRAWVAFTMFWFFLILLYSKQTDMVLAEDDQSMGQPPGLFQWSSQAHAQRCNCKASHPLFYVFTNHEKAARH